MPVLPARVFWELTCQYRDGNDRQANDHDHQQEKLSPQRAMPWNFRVLWCDMEHFPRRWPTLRTYPGLMIVSLTSRALRSLRRIWHPGLRNKYLAINAYTSWWRTTTRCCEASRRRCLRPCPLRFERSRTAERPSKH